MGGVFLSYAREDLPFVRRLHDALSAAGRVPAWDQDHAVVPFGAPYQSEIAAAIAGNEKFIFVISPDSVASGPCAAELAVAVESGKQIIPLLRRHPGDDQPIAEAVSERNWILFDDDARFQASIAELIETLDTDLDWAKAHTRLLVRSREWADGGDRSRLLRGRDLRAAETWLADVDAHPLARPTSDQRAFITASRRSADRTAWRQRAVLAVGLVIALALASFAFVQRGQAIRQRNLAASGQSAAESESFSGVDPVKEALLAAAAERIAPSAQARESMLDAYAQPQRAILPVSEDPGAAYAFATSVAFSPGGRILATAGGDGKARLWNLAAHTQIGSPITATSPFVLPSNPGEPAFWPFSVTFSPDGRILATAAGDIRLWTVGTHRQIGPAIASGSGADQVAFSPDGKVLAGAGRDGTVRLWDVATHRQIGSAMPVSRSVLGVADVRFDPDGRILATAAMGGKVQLWDVATHHPIGPPITSDSGDPAQVVALAFSPDGRILATGSDALTVGSRSDGKARLWDVATRRPIGGPIVISGGGHAVAFSPDGRILATGNGDGTARLWDVATRRQVGSLAPADSGASVEAVAFSPDGKMLATAGGDGTARLWDVSIYEQVGRPMEAYTSSSQAGAYNIVDKVAFSPDGRFLATADDDGTVRLWDVASQRQACQFLPGGSGAGADTLAFRPDGKTLATGGQDGVRFWSVATCRQAGRPMATGGRINSVTFSPSGHVLATAGDDGTFQFWDAATGRQASSPIKASPDPSLQVTDVAFSPDGETLATAGQDGTVRLWDVATHRQSGPSIQATSQKAQSVTAVAFGPDGKILATAGSDGTARLWDAGTHRQIGPVMSSAGSVAAVAFTPDGQILATGDVTAARLWDVATQHQIGPSMTPPGGVTAAALSPDGQMLATGGSDGMVELRDVAFPSDLTAAMCAIAGRSLTATEWSSYEQSVSYQMVCP